MCVVDIRLYLRDILGFVLRVFVARGSALCSISVAVVRKFVLLLPLIYIMPAFVADKTMGVYMAEPVADVVAITFTSILFTIQFGKAMKKLEA